MQSHPDAVSPAEIDRLIDVASGDAPADARGGDRRAQTRYPYDALVAAVLIGPTGSHTPPLVLRARDLSIGGICVTSRNMLYPGSTGAIQLVRSNGEAALVGVRVQFCSYAGAMMHHIGLEFVPMPVEIHIADFLDAQGRMIMLDPALRQNTEQGEGTDNE